MVCVSVEHSQSSFQLCHTHTHKNKLIKLVHRDAHSHKLYYAVVHIHTHTYWNLQYNISKALRKSPQININKLNHIKRMG